MSTHTSSLGAPSLKKRLIALTLGLIMLFGASALFQDSADRLKQSRHMERLNTSPTSALLSGVYQVAGTTQAATPGETVTTPYSKRDALYVQYREELRYKSGDKYKWKTVDSGTAGVASFLVQDDAGLVLIQTDLPQSGQFSRNVGGANWSLDKTYSRRSGDRRYTEWTLAPTDNVAVIGYYDPERRRLTIDARGLSFDTPIEPAVMVGARQQSESRNQAILAILVMTVSLTLVVLGTGVTLLALNIHRFWVFVTILGLVAMSQAFTLGTQSLKQEWQEVAKIADQRLQAAIQPNGFDQPHLDDLYVLAARLDSTSTGFFDRLFYRVALADFRDALPAQTDTKKAAIKAEVEEQLATLRFTLEETWQRYMLWGGLALGAFISYQGLATGLRHIARKRRIESIPTNRRGMLSFGLNKLRGRALSIHGDGASQHNPPDRLTSPMGREGVLAYTFLVERKKKNNWTVVSRECQSVDFYIQSEDGESQALVRPDGADITYIHEQITKDDPRAEEGTKRTLREYRYRETYLMPDDEIAVIGHAGLDSHQADQLAIQKERGLPFIITSKDDSALSFEGAMKGFMSITVGFAASLSLIMALLVVDGQVTPGSLLMAITLLPVFLMISTMVLHYNDLVFLKNQLIRRRQNVLTQMQKRADLWPNVESVVKRYFSHEHHLHTVLSQRRSVQASHTKHDVSTIFHDEIVAQKALIFHVESMPDLKAEPVIRDFQRIMTETEKYLAHLRYGYLDSIELYNTRIVSFPDLLIAKAFRFKTESRDIVPNAPTQGPDE